GTLLATGSTTITSAQQFTIRVKIGTGQVAGWEVQVGGVLEISGTGNLGVTNNGAINLGGKSAATALCYYDNVYVNQQVYPFTAATGNVQFQIDGLNTGSPVTLSGGI